MAYKIQQDFCCWTLSNIISIDVDDDSSDDGSDDGDYEDNDDGDDEDSYENEIIIL